MNILNKILFIGTLLLFQLFPARGQAEVKSTNDSLFLDESIRHGVLNNGLTYYIKQLEEPHPEISMNFIVKVGSNDEQSHEINFAHHIEHHIEHLAFRDSKNFPAGLKGNEQLLSRFNMHFSNLRGHTDMRATRYYFNTPAQEFSKALSTGLLWFKDIAAGLDLSKESIDRERGVLLQERRSDEAKADKNTTKSELYSKLFPCFNSSKNFTEHNRSFPYQNLQQFYKKWYQPDRMAVVIVGNIENVDKLEREIKNIFAELKPRDSPDGIGSCDEGNSENTTDYEIVSRTSNTDSNDSFNSIEMYLFYKDTVSIEHTNKWDRLKRKIQMELISSILNERFKASSRSYNNNFRNYSFYTTAAEKPPNTLTISIDTELDHEETSLANILNLLKQLKTYGITEEELELEKNKKVNDFHPSNIGKPGYWLNEIYDNFVYGEDLPIGKNSSLKQWLVKLSTVEINEMIMQVISNMPQDIGVIYPANSITIRYSEKKTRKFIKEEFSKPVSPYEVPKVRTNLLTDKTKASLPVEKTIKSGKGRLSSGKYVLKNGLTLILKPMKSGTGNSFITIHGFSPHGASCFPEEEYYSTMFAPSVIRNAGIGDFSKFDLVPFYQNTSSLKTGVSPYINYKEAGFEAEVSKEELEKLLQLIYLYFTEPREDKLAFENWKSEHLKNVSNTVSPTNDLIDALNEVTKDQSTLPYASRKVKASQKVDFDIAYQNYMKLFGNPGSFTFILAGDFDKKKVLPLLQKYLGNIPSTSNFCCTEEKEEVALSKGPGYFELGTSEYYNTENSFYGLNFVRKRTEEDDWKEELKVRVLGMIMDNLIYDLRAGEGLPLYEMGAGGKYNRIMDRYEIMFSFSCLPEQLPIVQKKTQHIINDLKSGKISKEIFSSQRNLLKSVFNSISLNQPSYKAKKIYRNYRYGEPLIGTSKIENFFINLTPEDIVDTARKYFQDKYLYEVKLE